LPSHALGAADRIFKWTKTSNNLPKPLFDRVLPGSPPQSVVPSDEGPKGSWGGGGFRGEAVFG